jgi:hypothetical protein
MPHGNLAAGHDAVSTRHSTPYPAMGNASQQSSRACGGVEGGKVREMKGSTEVIGLKQPG